MILVIGEQDVTSNAPNEELGHTARDLHANTQSEVQNRGEHQDQGIVGEGPPEAPPEHVSGGDHVDEEAHDTVQLGRPKGECLGRGNILHSLT